MKFSIVIPTHNHLEDLLKPCIDSIIKYTDLDPTDVFEEYKKGQISKVLDIKSLGQYYDKDDTNFIFGKPSIYKNK